MWKLYCQSQFNGQSCSSVLLHDQLRYCPIGQRAVTQGLHFITDYLYTKNVDIKDRINISLKSFYQYHISVTVPKKIYVNVQVVSAYSMLDGSICFKGVLSRLSLHTLYRCSASSPQNVVLDTSGLMR